MSWAEDDFQSEKMDRSRHRKSREGIASVPEAATPPRKKSRPPAGGLRLERERERERHAPPGAKKCDLLAARGGGVGGSGSESVFYDNFGAQTPFWVEILGS